MNFFKIFIWYIKTNKKTGKTSGIVTENTRKIAEEVMKERDKNHDKNKKDYGAGDIDEISLDEIAIGDVSPLLNF